MMPTMRSTLILVSVLVFVFHSSAQNPEEIQELIEFHILDCNNQLNTNQAYINQAGDGNDITVIQQNTGIISNIVFSEQVSGGNIGYIEQTGDAHLTVLNQSGQENEANIWSEGSLTYTQVEQFGSGNMVNSYIDNDGLLPKAALLQQNGNNNVIDFALLGNGCLWNSWPKGAYIKQTGDNLEVTALFDSYQSPVYIEQQSGAGGGMKINVSTTAFSFPMKKF